MSKVLTLGSFDLFHLGHVYLFEQCKRIAGPDGTLVVSINSDEFIASFKSAPPVQSYAERRDMVLSCRWVDEVDITTEHDAKPIIERHLPDFLVIGSDWANRPYHEQIQVTPEWLSERGIALLYLDRWSLFSSTNLKERIRA